MLSENSYTFKHKPWYFVVRVSGLFGWAGPIFVSCPKISNALIDARFSKLRPFTDGGVPCSLQIFDLFSPLVRAATVPHRAEETSVHRIAGPRRRAV